jgi:hypothetical protein
MSVEGFLDTVHRTTQRLRSQEQSQSASIMRKHLVFGSVSTPLHLISLGCVGFWTIGVFFAAGYAFLVHSSAPPAFDGPVADRSDGPPLAPVDGTPSPPFKRDSPGAPVASDGRAATSLEAPSFSPPEWGDYTNPESQIARPSENTQRAALPPLNAADRHAPVQLAHPGSRHERRRRRAFGTGSPRVSREAVRDLLHQYSKLLK